jgi:hypothetical protein
MKRGGAASCGEGIQGSECAGSARPRGAHADEEFVASRGSYTTVRTVPARRRCPARRRRWPRRSVP